MSCNKKESKVKKPVETPNLSEKEIQLKGDERIRAKKNLYGHSSCWSMPERIEISKGTVLKVPKEGTYMGDCFCYLIEGKCIKTTRSMLQSSDGKIIIMETGDTVGLSQGYKSAAYALGKIETDCWEIIE